MLVCFGRRSALVFVVISVFLATGVRTRLTATWILVALIAALLLTALIPDRVGEHVHNSIILTGMFGSSLLISSSHDRGHFSAAMYRTTRFMHEPGWSVAGNGLLMSFQ